MKGDRPIYDIPPPEENSEVHRTQRAFSKGTAAWDPHISLAVAERLKSPVTIMIKVEIAASCSDSYRYFRIRNLLHHGASTQSSIVV